MPSDTQHLGTQVENCALEYLMQQGLVLIQRNFSCKQGEIDLIMQDQHYYVFVEVRFRHNPQHGSPLESVTRSKQIKIIKAATLYLVQKGLYDKVSCRFDVVALATWQGPIHWIKNAFQVK